MKMNVIKFANKKLVACAAIIAAGVTTAMGYQRGNKYGDLVLRAGHQAHLCHRCRRGTYRRREGVRQVQFWRSRHLEDRSLMVRCLYLPYRGRYHPALVLPLSLYIIIRYKEDNSE